MYIDYRFLDLEGKAVEQSIDSDLIIVRNKINVPTHIYYINENKAKGGRRDERY